jgi:hypothetical protein
VNDTLHLADIVRAGRDALHQRYGAQLTHAHHRALDAITQCRTGAYGGAVMACTCGAISQRLRSCGHRACPRCQHHAGSAWLAREQAKLLPVDYFMATFTLPAALRPLAQREPTRVFGVLFDAAIATLQHFARHDGRLQARLGACAVLHTHSRRLDFHPHLHVVIAGGALDPVQRRWRALTGPRPYLFNGNALARVFRAKCLAAFARLGLALPVGVTPRWVVHCNRVGSGLPALKYLSRYLYRGVLAERDLVACDGSQVTFRYRDARTRKPAQRTLPIADFLWHLLQHVLPNRFRRARDFGFLHGNAKPLLRLLQLMLHVRVPGPVPRAATTFVCRVCGATMHTVFTTPAPPRPG